MGDCCGCDAFRFFTPLRCVQNDREEGVAFRMTGGERAAFGMAGWRGDGNDRMEVAGFGMAGKGCCVRDGRI